MNTITPTQKMASFVLKAIVIISATVGTLISYLAGRYSFMGCAWWILLLLIFLVIIGYAYLAIANLIRKKRSTTFDKVSYSH